MYPLASHKNGIDSIRRHNYRKNKALFRLDNKNETATALCG